MEERQFLMPDYYPDFHCKGGSCRSNCCFGWKVTMSMEDYFRMVGVDCSPSLRRKIDTSLHILNDATPDRYAEISHDWQGLCHMLDEDGYCAFQRELGEDCMTSTCRYHPRGIKTIHDNQCCTSCSCEATIETLLNHRARQLCRCLCHP
ncbi:MAG: hypothetical protein MJ099_02290 [Clostridia bacterium]|nr:hypothetical protein [Clostridia bacterium]